MRCNMYVIVAAPGCPDNERMRQPPGLQAGEGVGGANPLYTELTWGYPTEPPTTSRGLREEPRAD